MLSLKPFRRRAALAAQKPALQHGGASHGDGPVAPLDGMDAASLADQPSIRTVETLRFADTDLNGHVTHPVVAALFQNGRALLLSNHARQFSSPRMRWVTRLVTIDCGSASANDPAPAGRQHP